MSAQINLYHPRFLKQRELLTLGKLSIAAVALYAVLAGLGAWAWQYAAERKAAAAAAEAQLKVAKQDVDAATAAAANRKPSARLVAEMELAESLLRRRAEIARLLENGTIGNTGGFAEYLRGFARQKPDGLWLTGFTLGAGGADMEIRGRMLSPAALPDYIRRLGAEKAFQGRNFAALTMKRAEPSAVAAAATPNLAAPPAPTLAARPIDFVLTPKRADAKDAKS